MTSNYERIKEQMQGEFLKYNQASMIKRFPIDSNEEYLIFDFMGGASRINRKTGLVESRYLLTDIFQEADYNEAMTVYDILCWSKPDAVPSGQFVNMESIIKMHNTLSRSGSGFFCQEAKMFNHKNMILCNVLEKLGGTIIDGGDVTAKIPLFDGWSFLFRFWNSDDEFTQEIQFFWDANVLSFMHYETVWFANHVIIRRIREMMEKY